MNIFLTGATGFLGYHMAVTALEQGHRLLCLRRSPSRGVHQLNHHALEWVDSDNTLASQVSSFKPDVLIHAAWAGVRNARRDYETQHHNIQLTLSLAKLYPYKRIIAFGSQEEYGIYTAPVAENAPLLPGTAYGQAKVACCENLANLCTQCGTEWQWLRIFTAFGEYQREGLIPSLLHSIKDGATSFETSPGQQTYSYMYARDFALSTLQILKTSGKSGIYNICQPEELHTNRDIIRHILELTNSKIKIRYGALPYAPSQIMMMSGITEKFEQAFGPIPRTCFHTALEKTVNSIIQLS